MLGHKNKTEGSGRGPGAEAKCGLPIVKRTEP